MKVGVVNASSPFTRGGAEYFAEALVDALEAQGHQAMVIAIPIAGDHGDQILDRMLAFRMLRVPVDLLIGLKFPGYLIPHPRKIVWMLHQYRIAYDLWDHGKGHLLNHPHGTQVRQAIMQADNLAAGEADAVYTISKTVSARLMKYNAISAPFIYTPPPGAERFRTGPAKDYILCVSRINSLKRQHLLIEALAHTTEPVQLVIAGSDVQREYFDVMVARAGRLGVTDRVTWLTDFPEEDKVALYAEALAVAFVPLDEDYGYVTLEAMLSAKPVLTALDSGGVLEFVRDAETGYVVAPDPVSIAAGLDRLWQSRDLSRRLGEAGRDAYNDLNISWPGALRTLLA